ncbi:L-lactate permease [Caldicellulosiruptor acetigenus]|uniref:L-lactate permease n=1 Tax=Caldicellulosiruptor acetigenus TaxID=301953 RepID=UPI00041352D4|nr:L-lactate permease [Caldicellulosiruptor acetigenus]WAM36413.1 L-lactate permease [Caldicellulosiruptor acetigenus]
MDLFLSVLPILLVLFLLIFAKKTADVAGLVGWVATALIAIVYFKTSFDVVLKSSIMGFLAALPVSLVVVTSILQLNVMESAGAMKRIIVFVKGLSKDDKVFQALILNVGFGTFLAATGAVPVTVLPPILIGLGYSTFAAIALSAVGFDALCTYALLGTPLVVFSQIANVDLITSARYFLPFVGVVSFTISLAMLFIIGNSKFVKRGFVPAIIVGLTSYAAAELAILVKAPVITGIFAGILIMLVMMAILKLLGKRVYDSSHFTEEDRKVEKTMGIIKATSPWILLVVFILITNLITPIREFLYDKLSMPVEVMKGPKIKPIFTRVIWQSYTWILLSTIISIFIFKMNGKELKSVWEKTKSRIPKPFWSSTVFFLMAYVMMYSGYQKTSNGYELLQKTHNIVYVLAEYSAKGFKNAYAFVAPYLGILGGFITGTETSTVAMFAKYTIETSNLLGLSPLLMVAAVAFGGGLASGISPSKLQNAAAAIDAIGQESKVLRTTLIISLIMAFVTGIISFLLRGYTIH